MTENKNITLLKRFFILFDDRFGLSDDARGFCSFISHLHEREIITTSESQTLLNILMHPQLSFYNEYQIYKPYLFEEGEKFKRLNYLKQIINYYERKFTNDSSKNNFV